MKARLDALKALLGIVGDEKDTQLKALIKMVEARVLSYINHTEMPKALEDVFVLICAEFYKANTVASDADSSQKVASISRGDVTISYDNSAANSASSLTSQGDGFFGWRSVLQEHRRLRW